jgi:hypothetical protein
MTAGYLYITYNTGQTVRCAAPTEVRWDAGVLSVRTASGWITYVGVANWRLADG